MKKKVFVSNIPSLIFFLTVMILPMLLAWINFDKENSKLLSTLIVSSSLFAVLIFWVICDSFAYSILTHENIAFGFRIPGKKQTIQVGEINRFVVCFSKIDRPRQRYLIIRANNKNGPILGLGNSVLMALMKYYPHIPVILKDIDWRMMRATAKYIVKHQKTSKFKCKQLCEYYHLPKKLLEYTGDSNNSGNSDIE